MFVSGLTTGFAPGTYVAQSAEPLPFSLAGLGVDVNGAAAPILAVVIPPAGGLAQINFQVPLERNFENPLSSQPGTLEVDLSIGGSIALSPLAAAPVFGGFFSDGKGYAIAQHAADYSRVAIDNPAHPGETIIVYADDVFKVWPPPPIGFPVPATPLFQYQPKLLSYRPDPGHLYLQAYPGTAPPPLSGSHPNTPPLAILFQGLVPGLVGVEQINFVVPADQQSGDWALFFNTACLPGQASGCSPSPGSSPFVKLPVR
jgi:uncharacterized protein (TIGR03437 family)